MTDPVLAADGFTYERCAIEGWFKKSGVSPMTNLPLPNQNLIPNASVATFLRSIGGSL